MATNSLSQRRGLLKRPKICLPPPPPPPGSPPPPEWPAGWPIEWQASGDAQHLDPPFWSSLYAVNLSRTAAAGVYSGDGPGDFDFVHTYVLTFDLITGTAELTTVLESATFGTYHGHATHAGDGVPPVGPFLFSPDYSPDNVAESCNLAQL